MREGTLFHLSTPLITVTIPTSRCLVAMINPINKTSVGMMRTITEHTTRLRATHSMMMQVGSDCTRPASPEGGGEGGWLAVSGEYGKSQGQQYGESSWYVPLDFNAEEWRSDRVLPRGMGGLLQCSTCCSLLEDMLSCCGRESTCA